MNEAELLVTHILDTDLGRKTARSLSQVRGGSMQHLASKLVQGLIRMQAGRETGSNNDGLGER